MRGSFLMFHFWQFMFFPRGVLLYIVCIYAGDYGNLPLLLVKAMIVGIALTDELLDLGKEMAAR